MAAERTLLAWIRTGITVIALGFVVARFGLFLGFLSVPDSAQRALESPVVFSTVLGVVLVLLGSVTIAAAALQHRQFVLTLPAEDLPDGYRRAVVVLLAFALAVLGLVLGFYLVAT